MTAVARVGCRARPGSSVKLVVLLAVCGWACSRPPLDLQKELELSDVTTGWFDAGIVDGKNKLVPTISLKLKNRSRYEIRGVQLNVVFRRVGEEEEWDAMLTRGVGSEGLPPDSETSLITVRARLGYTGEQPRAEMLQHGLFVDARAQLFAKHGSAQWVEIGDIPIERQVLVR